MENVDGVWKGLCQYEKMLHGVSWKWARKVGKRVEKDDLYQELVLVYYSCRNKYINLDEKQFVKVLYTAANHRCVDIVAHQDANMLPMEYDDGTPVEIEVSVESGVFKELFSKYFLQDLEYLLEGCEEAREIFKTILDFPSELEGLIGQVPGGRVRKQWKVCKMDIQRHLVDEGMSVSGYRRGLGELKDAVRRLVEK